MVYLTRRTVLMERPAYLQLLPEFWIWNQPLKHALRLCGAPIVAKRGGEGVLSSAEKVIVVLALRVSRRQRVACQSIIIDDMRWNEWEQTLGGRSKDNHVSVNGESEVATAVEKILQTSKPRCSGGLGWKLACPNQFRDHLSEPR